MFISLFAQNHSVSQALPRLIESLQQKGDLPRAVAADLDFEQPAPKNLKTLIPALKPDGLVVSLLSVRDPGEHLPLERLTVAGALLARAMVAGPTGMQEFCDVMATRHHSHVPMAILPHAQGLHSDGLNILQLLAQWRWRGQASPLAIDVSLGQVSTALQRQSSEVLGPELGRVAAWCVAHDWGQGPEARSGQTATHAFIALLKAGAVVPQLNDMAFPDPLDAEGRLPVLLAVIEHGAPEDLPLLVATLLAQGAQPDAASSFGKTPLMACVDSRLGVHASEVAMKLLARGASPRLQNKDGLTVLDQMEAAEQARAFHVQRIVPLARETEPTRFRDSIVSAIKSSMARGTAMSLLAEIENELLPS